MSTRWLSLETTVTRTLRLYQLLRSYFLSQEVRSNLSSYICRSHDKRFSFFLPNALQSFVNFNKYLQKEERLISRLHDQIQQFIKRIACKFLQIDLVTNEDIFSDDIMFFSNSSITFQYNHLGSFTLLFVCGECMGWYSEMCHGGYLHKKAT